MTIDIYFWQVTMKKKNEKNATKEIKFLTKIGYGLSAAALIGAYSLCTAASLGRGAVFVLVCIIFCALFSLKGKAQVFAPAALLMLPLFAFSQSMPLFYCGFAILGGGIICLVLNLISKNKYVPDCIIAGGALGLAIGVTVMLTNVYFGIGSFGGTVLEMLKNYRYLGFHPDFRGLLYGTITLFTMITYPFKFRKLNKYLPAEFITILVPFVINLLLNPDRETTTTNEYVLATIINPDASNVPHIAEVMGIAFAYGLIFYGFSKSKDKLFPVTNMATGSISGTAVAPYPVRGYTAISSFIVILISSVIIFCFPNVIARFPLPCAGSMLIVSAWQHVPFRSISSTVKEKSVIKTLVMLICAVSFIVFSTPIAVAVCAVLAVITSKIPSRKGKEATA